MASRRDNGYLPELEELWGAVNRVYHVDLRQVIDVFAQFDKPLS